VSMEITITIKGISTPEVFEINERYRMFFFEETTMTPVGRIDAVDELTKRTRENVLKYGAYTHVIDDRSVIIPLNNILKIEIKKR
jgi:hypothetical protein